MADLTKKFHEQQDANTLKMGCQVADAEVDLCPCGSKQSFAKCHGAPCECGSGKPKFKCCHTDDI
ncbi:MAG: SEC-C metal-binding domain-containing protein [Deferrisomatales bacterium]|nr:SEC-C metal-binding domain-containing protein [Deferrisomatales bacterium]